MIHLNQSIDKIVCPQMPLKDESRGKKKKKPSEETSQWAEHVFKKCLDQENLSKTLLVSHCTLRIYFDCCAQAFDLMLGTGIRKDESYFS